MTAAVFCMVRDERLMLPLWLRYYTQHFGDEHTYVLDHETQDGSTEGLSCQVRHVTNGGLGYDHEWMLRQVEAMQRELLGRYDAVLYTDVDEIVVHFDGIGEYARNMPVLADRCTGYHVRQRQHEPDYRPHVSFNEQRRWWQPDETYDKPLLSTIPLRWVVGYHRSLNLRIEPNPGLVLLHLHWFDRRMCVQRHADRNGWTWHPGEKALESAAWQWRLTREELDERMQDGSESWEPITEWCRKQVAEAL